MLAVAKEAALGAGELIRRAWGEGGVCRVAAIKHLRLAINLESVCHPPASCV